ncbi:MAG: SDR family oxidoreductase [Bacteroidia bacterium]|nr:SDR family oxidoreductase [Bacteroidia bacterium]
MNLFDVNGKCVVVTGASQGIGEAIAKAYAEAGARVYLNARNPDKLSQAVKKFRKENLIVYPALFDVTVKEEVEQGIGKIVEDSGRLDVVVNNAGIIRRNSLEELEEEDWEAVIKTDLTAPFLVGKYAARHMIPAGGGKIINICSLMSELGRNTVAAYAAAKGGLKMLTRSMATDWAKHNIQANGIGPGYIATPINTAYRAEGNPLNEYILSRTPAGRWGTPDDLIGAAIFLASSASDFVNGQIIYVDGGVLATFGDPGK